ncbi:MAG: MFS transporter [Lentisphaeria bacterium]|nr:MFS transporter [Lentisphaeria bacterium]
MKEKTPKRYHCGSLSYTLPQLCQLFFWLMLGTMVMGLANTLPGSILPIQIKGLGLTDTQKWLILSCIGTVLNMTVCPYISVVSDLKRSRLGRRIPYIITSLPPVVLALVLFAFTQKFGAQLSAWVQPFWAASPATMTAIVMGLVMFLFQFFMMWVNSVIWYIFIDIVPAEFFSRIMAFVRLGLQLGSAIFQYCLFPHAEAHARAIFLSVAAVYAVGMTLMCIFVKEGEYPPLTEEELKRKNATGMDMLVTKIKGFKEFLSFTFCHRIYVYRYLMGVSMAIAGAAGTFGYFMMSTQFHMTDAHIGKMNGLCGTIYAFGILLAAFIATLVNRWHPTRIIAYNAVFTLSTIPLVTKFLFGTLAPDVYVWYFVISAAINLALSGLIAISEQPMEMLLFPKSRYGTFCAMQAMFRSWSALLIGFIVARLFDFISHHFNDCWLAVTYGENWHYRLISPWTFPWYLVHIFVAYKVYRHWAKLGGYAHYASPAPWCPDGKDPVDKLPCKPVNPRTFQKSLFAIDGSFLLITLAMPLFAIWNCKWRLAEHIVDPANLANAPKLDIIRDFFCAGGDASLFNGYLFWPIILILVADAMWIILRLHLHRKATRNPDGTGLIQPALLLFYVVLHIAGIFNNFFAIARTPGTFGVTCMILEASTMITLVLTIIILDFMERGVKVDIVEETPATEPAK